MTDKANDDYITAFDGLRFFAVFMVMIAHWIQWEWANTMLARIPFVHGVTLFFVLSGFLITRILLINNDVSIYRQGGKLHVLKIFYIRRMLRIFPSYYILLVVLFFLDYKNTRELFPWLLTFSSNVYQSMHNVYVGSFNHFWSLAVEEQFYLFWPCLMLWTEAKRTWRVIVLTLGVSVLFKLYLFLFTGKWLAISYFTLSCMYTLGLGALLAYLSVYKKEIIRYFSNAWWLYAMCFVYLLMIVIQAQCNMRFYAEVIDEMLFAHLAVLIILKLYVGDYKGWMKNILENKVIVFLGKISYGLYLYHLFIFDLYDYIAPFAGVSIHNAYALFIVLFLLTVLIAVASWYLIEKPISKIKSKYHYVS